MEIESKLEKILKKLFKKVNLKKKNFEKIKLDELKGWDSLKHFYFLLEVEKDFKIRFTPEKFAKIKSLKDVILEIKNAKKSS